MVEQLRSPVVLTDGGDSIQSQLRRSQQLEKDLVKSIPNNYLQGLLGEKRAPVLSARLAGKPVAPETNDLRRCPGNVNSESVRRGLPAHRPRIQFSHSCQSMARPDPG